MWRVANEGDDDRIVQLCLELYREDPAGEPVPAEHTRRTLEVFRREPARGRAVVLELDGIVRGYALLVSFWSNELGGAVCEVDELFVAREHRGRGHGSALFDAIENELWPEDIVAIVLITTAGNARARSLYERLGFRPVGQSMAKRLASQGLP